MKKLIIIALIAAMVLCAVPASGYTTTHYGNGLYYVHCTEWDGGKNEDNCARGILEIIGAHNVTSIASYNNDGYGTTSGYFVITKE